MKKKKEKKEKIDRSLPPSQMKPKMGRPSIYEESPTYFDREGEKLATLGVSQRDMAWYWGISEDSITRWKEIHSTFAEALKKGESSKRISLLTAMYQSAIGPKKSAALQIFLAKNWLGMKDVNELGLVGTDNPVRLTIIPAKKRNDPADGPK